MMSRPLKSGLDYFPHDTDALSDEKIEALMMLHGPAGYMFYFVMLERIYRTKGFELVISDAETRQKLDRNSAEIRQILARKMQITVQEFDNILSTALKFGCFDKEAYEKRGVLTSNGIKKRAGVVVKKRERMRVAHHQQAAKVSDAETRQKLGRNLTETRQKPPKEKESKVKESKINNIYSAVVNHLNQKAGTSYRPTTESTRRLINARLNEGFTEADFKMVIDKKASEWAGTDLAKYLRPETLFGPKFESYFQSTNGIKTKSNHHPEGFEVIR